MPAINKLHVDKLLSNIKVKYKNADYVADKIFPTLPVKKSTDLYRVYARNFRIPETKRANKGLAKEHQFDVSTASYILENHALKDYISDDDIDNYDLASLRADTTEELTDVIYRKREKQMADLFTTTNWSLNVSLAAANAWNANTTLSNPIPIVHTGTTEVIQNSGYMPNFMVYSREAHVAVVNHVSVLDRVKYTSAEVTKKMIASLFEIDELIVANAVFDSSDEGLAEVIGSIWGDGAFIGFKPSKASPIKPSCGYIFQKKAPSVKRWRDEERESEGIEVGDKRDIKIVASLTGFLIKDVV